MTVTAQDAGGLRATQAFAVTVANRSPLPLGTLPALDLQYDTALQRFRGYASLERCNGGVVVEQ